MIHTATGRNYTGVVCVKGEGVKLIPQALDGGREVRYAGARVGVVLLGVKQVCAAL